MIPFQSNVTCDKTDGGGRAPHRMLEGPKVMTSLDEAPEFEPWCIWVVVKIMVPLWESI